LLGHVWSGNVRELRNVIEQSVLLTSGNVIELEHSMLHLAPSMVASAQAAGISDGEIATPGAGTLIEAECDLIRRALVRSAGNVTLAARSLGISRDTLRYRMKKHNLPPEI
jgi:transcriptional regulator with PAS, ATPase and Fis domain